MRESGATWRPVLPNGQFLCNMDKMGKTDKAVMGGGSSRPSGAPSIHAAALRLGNTDVDPR
ncbi:hypothetical protein Ct61P_12798 [Colletotrichum tofieldiae]|nr:hypothetical protein Ct61P_12798 [Colletotrichum tofieldiae]